MHINYIMSYRKRRVLIGITIMDTNRRCMPNLPIMLILPFMPFMLIMPIMLKMQILSKLPSALTLRTLQMSKIKLLFCVLFSNLKPFSLFFVIRAQNELSHHFQKNWHKWHKWHKWQNWHTQHTPSIWWWHLGYLGIIILKVGWAKLVLFVQNFHFFVFLLFVIFSILKKRIRFLFRF